jgi:hypothetical protein
LIQRDVLQFALRAVVAAENELSDCNASGIEARYKRRNGTGRHERARAIDIADRLAHRRGHIGAGMEHEFHQCGALDALAFDVVNAGDVEEVILIIVGEKAFHLCRVHPAIGLRDIDGRIAHLREDVDRHPLNRKYRSKCHRDQNGDNRYRTAERKQDETHRWPLLFKRIFLIPRLSKAGMPRAVRAGAVCSETNSTD